MDESICNICREKIKPDNSLKCSGLCRNVFHLKCLNIAVKEANTLKSIEGYNWFCQGCMVYLQFFLQFGKEFNDFKWAVVSELCIMKEKLQCPIEDGKQKRDITYSSVASGEAVIIKPKAKQESTKTKEAVIKKLKPSAMEVGITQLKSIKDGGILIKCKTKEEIEKVKRKAEKTLGRHYQVKIPQLINPCLKVVDLEDTIDPKDLVECIKKQNTFLRHEEIEIKVIVVKKMVNKYMAILECDPLTHAKILEAGHLCIGWSASCRVFDYVKMFRCFKCGDFDHKAENCSIEQICLRCGAEDHVKRDCKVENFSCRHCIASSKWKTEIKS